MLTINACTFTAEYYLPDKAKGKGADYSIPAGGVLPIGYGSSGREPREYWLREGQNVDFGFIKLFVSTDYVDLSGISQPSPFDDNRADRPRTVDNRDAVWDTILIHVVQRGDPGSAQV